MRDDGSRGEIICSGRSPFASSRAEESDVGQRRRSGWWGRGAYPEGQPGRGSAEMPPRCGNSISRRCVSGVSNSLTLLSLDP